MKEFLNKRNQRSCKMKKIKQTVPYNLKKVLAGIMLVAVPVFVSCEKDPVKPDNNNGNNQQPQKHNVELVYSRAPSTQWQNISMDTINKYNSDPTVDSIFMIPEDVNQFSNLNATQLSTGLVPKLRERHNINPNKVFGKGDIVLNNMVIDQNQEIVRFFADTLRYNVR